MKELQDLIAAWRALPSDADAVLATVVATAGSTYRKPGARMLVTRDGWVAGSVSGGCLEGDVLSTAWSRTEAGPTLVTYDSTSDDDIVWGFGLGCKGSVTVLFQRLDAQGCGLEFLADMITARRLGVLATVVSGADLGDNRWISDGTQLDDALRRRAGEVLADRTSVIADVDGRDVLFEYVQPPLALVIFGAGHDAIPLVEAAKAMAWHVTVVDHRSAFADPTRFPRADAVTTAQPADVGEAVQVEPGSAAVVMTHNYLTDLAILGRLLKMPLLYLGQLGPRARTNRLLDDLAKEGIPPTADELAKLRAPIGLDLGGSSAEEVALAVVAEIQAAVRGRDGAPLSGYAGPLHEPGPSLSSTKTEEPIACPTSR